MIHAYKLNGQRIVLDSASGAVHVLSALAFKMIDYLKPPLEPECPSALRYDLAKYDSADVEEAYSELYRLYKDGTLFSDDIKIPVVPAQYLKIKSMCLHIAHDCNMRCKYCFADSGDYTRLRSLMSPEVGCRALDFLCERSGKLHNLEVDFFGGEPLMNFETVKAVTVYGRELEKKYDKTIRFTMTTNGFAARERIDRVYQPRVLERRALHIDGRASCQRRSNACFRGRQRQHTTSFCRKFKKLVEARGRRKLLLVRGTFPAPTCISADDVLHLAGRRLYRDIGRVRLCCRSQTAFDTRGGSARNLRRIRKSSPKR